MATLLQNFFQAFLLLVAILLHIHATTSQDLPTVYEHFAADGRNSGLTADSDSLFRLNGKPIRIVSGAMHYFRIHPALWRDRLKKLRASGANTLETYVPWNLHEPYMGQYDFGLDPDMNEYSAFLDVRRYIQMAQEEDLLVIFRPGPYICSEWEFGGLPSYLLRDPEMAVRSSNAAYEARVKAYFDQLLPLVEDLMWSNGGPVIMVQIENEYGAFGTEDKAHLEFIKSLMESHGIQELFATSDSPLTAADTGAIPGVLQTANFYDNSAGQLNALLALQPDKPVLVMEYWSGWFDHWYEPFHNARPVSVFRENLYAIYNDYNGSVNFYMFHGGTSYGFLAGANNIPIFPNYVPDVSSYDYNAPLSESGDYTEKYYVLRNLTEQYALPPLFRPELPELTTKVAYPNFTLQSYLSYDDLLSQIPQDLWFNYDAPVPMELLPINEGSGQSYGYILYRVKAVVGNGSVVQIGRARDMATLLVDSEIKSNPPSSSLQLISDFGYWTREVQEQVLTFQVDDSEPKERTIDLLVENMGRVNFGGPEDFLQFKGLHEGNITVDGVLQQEIITVPLEFKSSWVKNLTGWRPLTPLDLPMTGPVLLRTEFMLEAPADTWLNMRGWHKGIVFVNGLNLGRYFKVGPPHTLFIPAPLLNSGLNTVIVFEQFKTDIQLTFSDIPILGNYQ